MFCSGVLPPARASVMVCRNLRAASGSFSIIAAASSLKRIADPGQAADQRDQHQCRACRTRDVMRLQPVHHRAQRVARENADQQAARRTRAPGTARRPARWPPERPAPGSCWCCAGDPRAQRILRQQPSRRRCFAVGGVGGRGRRPRRRRIDICRAGASIAGPPNGSDLHPPAYSMPPMRLTRSPGRHRAEWASVITRVDPSCRRMVMA